MTITFDTEKIRLINFFENLTGAPVRDCIVDENIIYFIIEEGKVGIAIGKNGNSVKHAEKILEKSIKLFEFSKDLSSFVKNMIPQSTGVKIRNEGDKIIVEIKVGKKDRAMIIGRDRRNLKIFKEILQRNHHVNNLLVK